MDSNYARRRFREAYRALRMQNRFLIELDDLIDRYRSLNHRPVPWDKLYATCNEIYLENITVAIRHAAYYALEGGYSEERRFGQPKNDIQVKCFDQANVGGHLT